MTEYPSNSNRSKEAQRPEKNIQPVVKGKVATKKKTGFRWLASFFVEDDVDDVGSYIWTNVIVPYIKKTVLDSIKAVFYGSEAKSEKKETNAYRASYRSYYDSPKEDAPRPSSRSYSYNDIIISDRGEAELVLDRMREILQHYKIVSVADLCELCNVKAEYTDQNYGWTSLDRAEVNRFRDGYTIRLPKPMPID